MSDFNDCTGIVTDYGTSWHFDAKGGNSNLTFYDALGDRNSPIQDINCFVMTATSYVAIANSHYLNNLAYGSFTIGMYISMPIASNDGSEHTLFAKQDDFRLYQLDGHLYFDIGEGTETIDTSLSGVDYCDGDTYFVQAYRDSRYDTPRLGIEVFGSYSNELDITTNPNLQSEEGLTIGVHDHPSNGLQTYAYVGTTFQGVFFLTGNILSLKEKQEYWLKGTVPVNDVAFYQLDESVGEIAYDSSGLHHHGIIQNYTTSNWTTIEQGFSWQNMYGYSTGQYLIDNGTSTVDVDGTPTAITAGAMIPYENGRPYKDVVSELDLEYEGRCGHNISLESILCFLANGATWGTLSTPSDVSYDPLVDEFSVVLLFEKVSGQSGILLSVGDTSTPKYRISIDDTTDELVILTGTTENTFALSDGFRKVIINFSSTQGTIYIDGSDTTFSLASDYAAVDAAYLFSHNGSNILSDGNVVVVGVADAILDEDARTAFFADEIVLPDNMKACFFPCSQYSVLFDISGNSNHCTLSDYDSEVWDGEQSLFPYLINGFSRVFPSISDKSESVYIPFAIDGRKINYNVYDDEQLVVSYTTVDGMPLFDCYINMNPEDRELGFYSKFWSKDSSEIWGTLNSSYIKSNPFLWHSSELTQSYLETALNTDYYNYAFVQGSYSKEDIQIDLVDLVLLNLGNNITPKYLPI